MSGQAPISHGLITAPGGLARKDSPPLGTRLHAWWRRMRVGPLGFLQYKSAAFGFWMVVFWIVVACLAPLLAPYPPNAMVGKNVAPPSQTNLLGADNMGRDILSRTIWGARPILVLAPIAVAIATVLGVAVGLFAGYLGGAGDDVLMRLLDAAMAFPTLLLYLVIIAALGPSKVNVVLAIAIAGFPGVARLVRSMVLDVKNREFVAAARLRGESTAYILFREIMPNCMGPVFIDACLRVGYAAFAIGTLGFLGLGLPPPDPDWGKMVADGRVWIITAPWMVLVPSLAISSLVVGLNLFADGVNAAGRRF
jgi:peptide/nickel transport system permease protein